MLTVQQKMTGLPTVHDNFGDMLFVFGGVKVHFVFFPVFSGGSEHFVHDAPAVKV